MSKKVTCEYCGRRITSEHCPYCGAVNKLDFEVIEQIEREHATEEHVQSVFQTVLKIFKGTWKMILIAGSALILIFIIAVARVVFFGDAGESNKTMDEIINTKGDEPNIGEGEYKFSDNIIECSESPELIVKTTDGSEIKITLPCSFEELNSACVLSTEYYDYKTDKKISLISTGLAIKPHRVFTLHDLNEHINFSLYNNSTVDKDYSECVIDEVYIRCSDYANKSFINEIYFDGHLLTRGPGEVLTELGEPYYISNRENNELSITYKTYFGEFNLFYSGGSLSSVDISHKAGQRVWD